MIYLPPFERGQPRDKDKVIFVEPPNTEMEPRPVAYVRGWTNLSLICSAIHGARIPGHGYVDVKGARHFTSRLYLMGPAKHLQLGMWFVTDEMFVVYSRWASVYFTRRGYGDLILKEMGRPIIRGSSSIDECTKWEGKLPVEGHEISLNMLREKYR